MNSSEIKPVETKSPQITIDSKSKSLNAIFSGLIAFGSLTLALLSSPIIFGYITAYEIGSVIGGFALIFIITVLAYNFGRGKLEEDASKNKKSIYRGAIIAIIALIFMGFAQRADIEANFSMKGTISDVKNIASNLQYNESTGSFDVPTIVDPQSKLGGIMAIYLPKLQELRDNLAKNINGLNQLNFDDIKNSSEFKDTKKITQIRDNFIAARDLKDDFYSEYKKLFLEMKGAVNDLGKSDTSSTTQEMIYGFNKGYENQSATFQKLKQLSLDYHNSQIVFLDFIITNNNKITIKNDMVLFENDDDIKKYNDLLKDAIEKEEAFTKNYAEFENKTKENMENNKNLFGQTK